MSSKTNKDCFTSLPMTDFCNRHNSSRLNIGPFQGPDSIFVATPRFAPGVIQMGPFQGLGDHCHKCILPQTFFGVVTTNEGAA